MSTLDMHDDDRPDAVRHADNGAQAWRAAARAQQSATPDHADFYRLAGELADTLDAVHDLARVMHGQVTSYAASLPEGSVVYDGSRDGNRRVDPVERLEAAGLLLDDLLGIVATASDRTNEFWSAISHIGVEDVTS